MDLSFSPDEEAFRAECRGWLEANAPRPPLPSGDTRTGFAAHLEWERKLFDARFAVVSWPEEFGGRDASLWEWLIFEEEYYRAGAPQRVTQNGIFLLAPTVFEFGTAEQQARILPKMAAGEQTWCQGWSEPNVGSDLAGIQSKAVRDEASGGWRLSGQKTWTTRGAFCTYMFGLFRSDPDAERHHGLTYFLVDLASPGVTVRGVERLDGDEGFAEVFLDDVFVPDTDVLGEPNRGWAVAMATTGSERGLTLRSPGRFLATAQRLIDLYHARAEDPELRDRVVAAYIDAEAYRWQTFWTVTRAVEGVPAGAESSMVKVFWSELDVRLHELALDLLGAHAELLDGDSGVWMKGYEFALAGPIYAGTNEIQRNVIAERVLGTAETLTMRFSFTDDQLTFRDAVRDLLEKECTPAHVRAAWTNATGRVPGLWAKLTDMGIVGMLAPEASGGLGLTMVDLVLILEETGRCVVPEPIVETAAFGVPLLERADLTIAAANDVVPWADTADVIFTGAGRFARTAVELVPRPSVDGARRVFEVRGTATPVERSALAAAFDRAVIGIAAQQCGLAQRMLDLTAEYAKERRQFGVPIGSFQAVKHHLANARIALEFARPLVYRAAATLEPVHAAMAKSKADQAALQTARAALQCHGAIGYTTEYDLHLYMKRAWALARSMGDGRHHRSRVGAAIL